MFKNISTLSRRFAEYCGRELAIDNKEKIAELQYGTYHIVSAIIKLTILYTIAAILGVFREILLSMAAFSLLRYFAGGVHARTHSGCTFVGNFVITYLPLLAAKLLNNISILRDTYNIIYSTSFILTIIIVIKYAPSDLKNKPVHSINLRRKLRLGAIITLLIYYIIIINIPTYASNIITVSAILEVASIMPTAYKLFRNEYGAGYGVKSMEVADYV